MGVKWMINILKLPVIALTVTAISAAVAVPVYASGGNNPGTPTGLQATPTDTAATITWSAPQDGDCPPTDYQVRIDAVSDGDSIRGNEVQSGWTATNLNPSTDYKVEVYTYSLACDDYSLAAATATFTTTAADSNNADTTNEPHAPKRIRDFTITATAGVNGSATLRWQKPGTGKRARSFYPATEYSIEIIPYDSNGVLQRNLERAIYDILDSGGTHTEAEVDGLVNGAKYRIGVAAYNSECNCWGKWRVQKYTHEDGGA